MVCAGLEQARAGVLRVAGCNSDERLDDSPSDRRCSAIVGRVGGEEVAIGRTGRRNRDPALCLEKELRLVSGLSAIRTALASAPRQLRLNKAISAKYRAAFLKENQHEQSRPHVRT